MGGKKKEDVSLSVLLFLFACFMRGESSHNFYLPLVEKCLVLWLWVEITEGLLMVFECDMRKI